MAAGRPICWKRSPTFAPGSGLRSATLREVDCRLPANNGSTARAWAVHARYQGRHGEFKLGTGRDPKEELAPKGELGSEVESNGRDPPALPDRGLQCEDPGGLRRDPVDPLADALDGPDLRRAHQRAAPLHGPACDGIASGASLAGFRLRAGHARPGADPARRRPRHGPHRARPLARWLGSGDGGTRSRHRGLAHRNRRGSERRDGRCGRAFPPRRSRDRRCGGSLAAGPLGLAGGRPAAGTPWRRRATAMPPPASPNGAPIAAISR